MILLQLWGVFMHSLAHRLWTYCIRNRLFLCNFSSIFSSAPTDIEFAVLDIIPYEDGNYDVVGQDDQGTLCL